MQVIGCGHLKRLRDLAAGELCIIQGGGHANLGIRLDQKGPEILVGLIDAQAESGRALNYDADIYCHALGTDYVIDVGGNGRQLPGSPNFELKPAVHLGPDGPSMFFSSQYGDGFYLFDFISRSIIHDWPQPVITFASFRIWADEASVHRREAKPLVAK